MGHVAPWFGFAALALQQGHQVQMAAPNVGQLEQLIGSRLPVTIWQAPFMRRAQSRESTSATTPKSWPELLVSLGYGQATHLTGAVKAWVNLMRSAGADVVIADYAPAVQLAAKVLGIRVIEAGGGFCVPPLDPVQCFPGVMQHDTTLMVDAEITLTTAFNAALLASGSSLVISGLAEFCEWPVCRLVLSPSHLDHYGKREGVIHIGLLGLGASQLVSEQSQSHRCGSYPSVVGYLKPGTPGLDSLITRLADAGVEARLFVPGSDASLSRGQVEVCGKPIDFKEGFKSADVYLSNGGLNGVGQALHDGCWPVVVPMQPEQAAMARTLVRQELGSIWMAQAAFDDLAFKNLFLRKRSTNDIGNEVRVQVTAESELLKIALEVETSIPK